MYQRRAVQPGARGNAPRELGRLDDAAVEVAPVAAVGLEDLAHPVAQGLGVGGPMRQHQFDFLDGRSLPERIGDSLGAAGEPHQNRAMHRIKHDRAGLRAPLALGG